MPYTVYILYSAEKDIYYIGQTEDVDKRLGEHIVRKNLGARDWKIVYKEQYISRAEAVKREQEIKSKKRRSYIEGLIHSNDQSVPHIMREGGRFDSDIFHTNKNKGFGFVARTLIWFHGR